MHKPVRILGTLLIAAGALGLLWVVVVWRWQDPFTAVYTHFQQAHLSHDYEQRVSAYHPEIQPGAKDLASLERQVANEARRYGLGLQVGDPVGRLTIGRIGLKMIVVQGTDEASLEKGPGHYVQSGLPGEGHLVYIAGHRTTFLAPFAEINAIRAGDYIRLAMPYGTFTYRAIRHYIVPASQVSVLRDHGHELLRLQACHPRFFATHRYIVDAKLVSVVPRGASAYDVTAQAS